MTDTAAPPTAITLASLANECRWVAWTSEVRNGKATKIPLNPRNLRPAKVPTDPNTWATRPEAQRAWIELQRSGSQAGGIGVVLGELNDGTSLMGIDLDGCYDGEHFTEWAEAVLQRFDSYAEISPSGRGVKLLFRVAARDIDSVRNIMQGRTRLAFAAGEHKEIALDRARFYCVTEDRVEGPETLNMIDLGTVRWLVEEAGPGFQHEHGQPSQQQSGEVIDLGTVRQQRDESGSGYGRRFFVECKTRGLDYDAARAAIGTDPVRAGDWARRVDERELRRAWEQARAARPDAAARLVDAVTSVVELFHTDDDSCFAGIVVDSHHECWPLRSRGFKRWLTHRCYTMFRTVPNRSKLDEAIDLLEARARFDGAECPVHVRVAALDGKLYLDLCDPQWRAVEIDSDGWRVVDNPPVQFIRAPGMLPLPEPTRGGRIAMLRRHLNVTDEQFILVCACLLAAMRSRGPYPVLVLNGEEGSGKSTVVRRLRALCDPSKVPIRTLPREERDLYIAASHGHVLSFDNVSTLPGWLSDAISRLATGGGFGTRRLYTDSEEVLIDVVRPVILNGIPRFVVRSDLADRCIQLRLSPMPAASRRTESELEAAFQRDRPKILGALLDAMASGLRLQAQVRIAERNRMADFEQWAEACIVATFGKGTFLRAYRGNRRALVQTVIDGDLVASAIITLLERDNATRFADTAWSGMASQLDMELRSIIPEREARSREYPATPRAMRGRLERLQAPLRKIGIVIEFVAERGHRSHIRIRCVRSETR